MAVDLGEFWIVLIVDANDGGLRLRVRSSFPERHGAIPATEAALAALVDAAVARIPPYPDGGWGDPPPRLALYVGGNAAERLNWGAVIRKTRTDLIQLGRRSWRPPRGWRLPLGVSGWGAEGEAALARLQQEWWTLPDSDYGVPIRRVGPEELALHLWRFAPEVLVVGGDKLTEALEEVRAVRGTRLVVTSAPWLQALRRPPRLPAGVALLELAAPLDPQVVGRLLLEIVHDFRIHDAAAIATGGAGFRLTADPGTNEGLRMSAALAGAVAEAMDLTAGGVAGTVARALEAPVAFGQERLGLRPLAVVEAHLANAQGSLGLGGPESPPGAQGERGVDITLLRRERSPVAEVATTALDRVCVGPTTSLRRRARYRVRVQIGVRSLRSLVVGLAPGVDPLLPPSVGGHVLDVALFPLDFRAAGPRVVSVHLPPTGPSAVATFDVQAPARVGAARLRVGVYYRDHLLQSWALDAQVRDEEAESAALTATLVFSRTRRLEDLDAFGPRAVSLGLNQTPRGSHAIMVKKGKEAFIVRLGEQAITDPVRRFRAILDGAAVAPSGFPVFPIAGPSGQPWSPAFMDTVRTLARFGVELRRALIARSPKQADLLRPLIHSSGEALQVVRYDLERPFPWAAIYDFKVPAEVAGQPADVCRGGAGCVGCEEGVRWCLRGFWGFRHQVEELIPCDGEVDEDRVTRITVGAPPAGLLLAVGDTTAPSIGFPAELATKTARWGAMALAPGRNLVAELWDPATRPAVLVVLGHHQVVDVDLEPNGSRVVLGPGVWLQPGPITDAVADGGQWQAQRPLVLLLTCTGVETTSATLNDFVTAFNAAGAGGIVGAECKLHAAQLADFGTRFLGHLHAGRTAGETLTAIRNELAEAGNPLGFAFTLIGDAGLTLA